MTVFAVTALRWDGEEVTHLLAGEVQKEGYAYKVDPGEMEVGRVVDLLHGGDTFALVFAGGLPGPNLKVCVLAHGRETVEALPSELPDKTLANMPTF